MLRAVMMLVVFAAPSVSASVARIVEQSGNLLEWCSDTSADNTYTEPKRIYECESPEPIRFSVRLENTAIYDMICITDGYSFESFDEYGFGDSYYYDYYYEYYYGDNANGDEEFWSDDVFDPPDPDASQDWCYWTVPSNEIVDIPFDGYIKYKFRAYSSKDPSVQEDESDIDQIWFHITEQEREALVIETGYNSIIAAVQLGNGTDDVLGKDANTFPLDDFVEAFTDVLNINRVKCEPGETYEQCEELFPEMVVDENVWFFDMDIISDIIFIEISIDEEYGTIMQDRVLGAYFSYPLVMKLRERGVVDWGCEDMSSMLNVLPEQSLLMEPVETEVIVEEAGLSTGVIVVLIIVALLVILGVIFVLVMTCKNKAAANMIKKKQLALDMQEKEIKRKTAELQAKEASLNQRKAQLENEFKAKESEISQLEAQIAGCTDDIEKQKLEAKLAELRGQVESTKSELNSVESETAKIRAENLKMQEDFKARVAAEHDAQANSLAAKLEEQKRKRAAKKAAKKKIQPQEPAETV